MDIRGKTVGLMHLGLSSEEAPVVTPLTEQSLIPIGLSIIGTYSAVPTSRIFMCKGKLRVSSKTYFRSTGFTRIPYYTVNKVVGYFFGKHNEGYFRIIGDLSVSSRLPIRTAGIIRQRSITIVKSIGILGYPSVFISGVTGVCKANYRTLTKIYGKIQRKQLNPIRITAVCKANYRKTVKTIGLLVYENKKHFRVTGVLATLAQSFVKSTGTIRQLSITPFRLMGKLANTVEHNFVRITGKINVAAFVSSVPKKVQEFVTNKTWWR